MNDLQKLFFLAMVEALVIGILAGYAIGRASTQWWPWQGGTAAAAEASR